MFCSNVPLLLWQYDCQNVFFFLLTPSLTKWHICSFIAWTWKNYIPALHLSVFSLQRQRGTSISLCMHESVLLREIIWDIFNVIAYGWLTTVTRLPCYINYIFSFFFPNFNLCIFCSSLLLVFFTVPPL